MSVIVNSNVIKTYLEITLKNGSKQRLFMFYFSSNQRIKILNEIKRRANFVGNQLNYDSEEILK